MTKKIGMVLIIAFVMSTDVFAQFYKQNPVVEFDVDFGGTRGVWHYSGFRPSKDDAWLEINLYFQWLVDKIDQILILTSFRHIENNTALDDRIKTFMRRNRLTLCITNYPNDLIGKTYILNYSFDNYNTFGFITIDTMKWIKSRDYHLE